MTVVNFDFNYTEEERARANAKTYVRTDDIKSAIAGREAEILAARGVAWESGTPHINCPYPDHPDNNPSWRWDDASKVAFCSCSKGMGIFDVLSKIDGTSFDEAKLEAARLIGRQDLIVGGEGQATLPAVVAAATNANKYYPADPGYLLNPPHDQKNPDITRNYLAGRLGVSPADIPMPNSYWTGWTQLDYVDTSAGKGKAVHVGRFPCAAFETRAADGRVHAHRIYTGPNGNGKADLGLTAAGKKRDVKKSATRKGNAKMTGCAVVWGNPDLAKAAVICEGIETAAAIAWIFKAELTAGQIYVASCIDKNGVKAFEPWPNTTRVVVATDRDEGKNAPGCPGHKDGELSANAFAAACRHGVSVKIAIPGQPGQDMDWLDVLLKEGVEAAATGLKSGVPFQPTQELLVERDEAAERKEALDRMAAQYPLPKLDSHLFSYQHTASGEIKMHRFEGMQINNQTLKKEPTWKPICTPFSMSAWLSYVNRERGKTGLRILVRGMDGEARAIEVERGALAVMGATEIMRLMYGEGMRIESDGDKIVVACLKGSQPDHGIAILSRPGWHALPGLDNLVFGTPGGEIIGIEAHHRVEMSDACIIEKTKSGSLEGWQNAVAVAAMQEDNRHWALGAIAGLVGPILTLINHDSCGVIFTGRTSLGKTTAMMLATSAWSSPFMGKGLMQSMKSTANALEVTAMSAHSTLLALDEMALADGKEVATMIYQIAGGIGKKRMSQRGDLLKSFQWSCFALMSGEVSLESKIVAAGGKWMPGMTVRFVEVDVSEVNPSVSPETMEKIDAVKENFGFAGPAFVKALVERGYHQDNHLLRDMITEAVRTVTGVHGDSVRRRAAQIFGLLHVAGTVAQECGILPASVNVGAVVTWAWERFLGSTSGQALDPEGQAIDYLRTWLAQRLDITLKNLKQGEDAYGARNSGSNQKAEGWYDADVIYLPAADRMLEAACGGILKQDHLARMLDRMGMLAKHDAGHLTVRYVPKMGAMRCYALSRRVLGMVNESRTQTTEVSENVLSTNGWGV